MNDNRDLALTFETDQTVTTCEGRWANVSDQGMIVEFLTPITNIKTADHIKKITMVFKVICPR